MSIKGQLNWHIAIQQVLCRMEKRSYTKYGYIDTELDQKP